MILSVLQTVQAFSLPSLDRGRTSPEPVKLPRNRLNQQFAVLLMRSVYDAVDALDFVSMVSLPALSSAEWSLAALKRKRVTLNLLQSEFQANFWKYRQSQYEPYTLQYSPIRIKQVLPV